MGFFRQEYWSGLPFSSPGDLPDSGIKPVSPALQVDFLTIWATREAPGYFHIMIISSIANQKLRWKCENNYILKSTDFFFLIYGSKTIKFPRKKLKENHFYNASYSRLDRCLLTSKLRQMFIYKKKKKKVVYGQGKGPVRDLQKFFPPQKWKNW